MLYTLDVHLLFILQNFHSKCPVLSNTNDNRQIMFRRCHQISMATAAPLAKAVGWNGQLFSEEKVKPSSKS